MLADFLENDPPSPSSRKKYIKQPGLHEVGVEDLAHALLAPLQRLSRLSSERAISYPGLACGACRDEAYAELQKEAVFLGRCPSVAAMSKRRFVNRRL